MKHLKLSFLGAAICIAPLFISAPTVAQQNQTPIPVTDMGVKQVRQSSNLKLTATNVNCDSAQTFEFSVEGGAWLKPPPNTTIPGLGKGQSGTINAQMDFTHTPPGIYYGHISSRCITCGWYILTACVESGEDTVIKVTVVDPAIDAQGTNLRDPGNPFKNLVAFAPPQIALVPPVSDEDMKFLSDKDRKRLIKARNNVKAAEARGRKARDAARLARKNKNDCERELARLKAEADAAKRKADIAKQDAANAAAAAKQAAKDLSDYEKDVEKAAKAMHRAVREMKALARSRTLHGERWGLNSPEYKKVDATVNTANDKVEATQREYSKTRASKEARQKQADQSRKEADAAKTAADNAKADAKAKKAKADAKERECKGLIKPIKDADKKVDDAKKNAKHHVGISNYEESEARKKVLNAQAKAAQIAKDKRLKAEKDKKKRLKQQEEDLNDAKKRCDTEVKEYSKYLTRMFKAVRDLTNMDKRKITDKDLNVEVTALDMAKEFASNAASNLISELNPVPTGETAFTALKAGYDIMKIKQLEYTSGRALYRGHDIMGDRLKEKGYAKNKAEGNKMAVDMDRIVAANGDTSFFYKELRDKIRRCHELEKRIAELKAK